MFNKNAFKQKDPVAEAIKSIAEQDYKLKLEALKGDQGKLDKNKNNKLDADDFKILRKEKKVEEATSPFDWKNRKSELPSKPGEKTGHDSKKTSTGTVYTKRPPKKDPEEIKEMVRSILEKPLDEDLKSVAKKVGSVAKKVGGKVLDTLGHKDDDELRKDMQRRDGAKGKQVHGMKSMAKYNEEVEQIDELSKKTLSKYVTRAAQDASYHAYDSGVAQAQGDPVKALKIDDRVSKREKGIQKAATKLAKEDVEQIDEKTVQQLKSAKKSYGKDAEYNRQRTRINNKWGFGWKSVKKARKAAGLTKEEFNALSEEAAVAIVEQYLEERKLSSGEKTEREKNVKGMKKNLAGFKARYGNRAKNVMYATATKMAKEEFDMEDIDPALVAEFMQTEEFAQLDELSKKTLASYAKKATDPGSTKSSMNLAIAGERAYSKGFGADGDTIHPSDRKAHVRSAGVQGAIKRLAKEEVEQIDELKKSTLASYADKAVLDVHNNAFRAGGKMSSGDVKGMKGNMVKSLKRQIGISKAAKKLAKD